MITQPEMSVEHETRRWVVGMGMAIALLLGMATAALARDPTREPARLSDEIRKLARPMGSALSTEPAASAVPLTDQPTVKMDYRRSEIAKSLWTILKDHHAGRLADARQGWEQIRLPHDTQIWKNIALGALYLKAGDLPQADLYLNAARQTQPDHAVVSYFTALLRLDQANRALPQPEDVGDRTFFVASVTSVTRNVPTKHAYELMAMAAFRAAIAHANEIQVDAPLLTMSAELSEFVYIPSVGQFLNALGSEGFVANSHDLLFGLELHHAMLIEAESHLDRAVAAGLKPLPWYEELMRAYLDQNQNQDALRVVKKYLRDNFAISGLTP